MHTDRILQNFDLIVRIFLLTTENKLPITKEAHPVDINEYLVKGIHFIS